MSRPTRFRCFIQKWDKVLQRWDEGRFKHGIVNNLVDGEFEGIKYTTSQDTGIKDKHGIDIYEGDIVRQDFVELFEDLGETKLTRQGRVYWAGGHGGFAVCWEFDDVTFTLEMPNLEVIGNVYANTEY